MVVYSFLLIFIILLKISIGKTYFKHFPSLDTSESAILKNTLVEDDFEHHVKILPNHKEIAFRLFFHQEIKLLVPITSLDPITLSLSPCSGALKWTLYLRPHKIVASNIKQKIENTNDGDSEVVSNTISPQYEDIDGSDMEILPRNRTRRYVRNHLRRQKRRYGVRTIPSNFSIPFNLTRPSVHYVFNGDERVVEYELESGSGKNPWLYQRQVAKPGLYILKVQSMSQFSKFQAMASTLIDLEVDRKHKIKVINSKEKSRKNMVTISWSDSEPREDDLYCLAVSRQKLYSSLCDAREPEKKLQISSKNVYDPSLILGCTPHSFYTFSVQPHIKHHVTVWKKNSLIPFVQAIVTAKSHRKIPSLKSGVMVPFTLNSGGFAVAKYNVRKSRKRLHIVAVSCSGGVRVAVLSGRERVALVEGKEALHLTIQRPPVAMLRIVVSPVPPIQALYRVTLVAAHSARKLPIPRLPNRVSINSEVLNCTTTKIYWSKAPGGASYCVIFRRHPSGRPPEIRPPIQCGWEHVISVKARDYFNILKCFNGTKRSRQKRTVTGLEPEASYLVNVLVRHPMTGKTLSLAPTIVNLPSCAE